jgi:hypothetical protein
LFLPENHRRRVQRVPRVRERAANVLRRRATALGILAAQEAAVPAWPSTLSTSSGIERSPRTSRGAKSASSSTTNLLHQRAVQALSFHCRSVLFRQCPRFKPPIFRRARLPISCMRPCTNRSSLSSFEWFVSIYLFHLKLMFNELFVSSRINLVM